MPRRPDRPTSRESASGSAERMPHSSRSRRSGSPKPVRGRGSARAALRDSRSGVGPTREEPGRLPGASARFALFGEVLIVGVLVAVLALPIVTIPLALGVGVRHLRRYVRAESTGSAAVLADLRRGVLPSLLFGVVVVVAAVVLALDLALAADRVLPGAEVILVVGIIGCLALALAVVTAAGLWNPTVGWRAALRATPAFVRADPVGAVYLLVAVGFVGLVSWQLPPLALPGLGLLALAIVAVPERPRGEASAR